MVSKLKSHTVLCPLIFTRPLASLAFPIVYPIVLSRSNLFKTKQHYWS